MAPGTPRVDGVELPSNVGGEHNHRPLVVADRGDLALHDAMSAAWSTGDMKKPAGTDSPMPFCSISALTVGLDCSRAISPGWFRTDEAGCFAFQAVRPVPYTIPDDGAVGRLLDAVGRHPWRPAHIHIVVQAPGFSSLTTHIFDAESEYLDRDTVFAVKRSLLRTFEQRSADDPQRPAGVDRPWVSLELDLILAPSSEVPDEVIDRGRTC